MSIEFDAGPCRLRPWRESDLAALVAQANDARVTHNLTHAFPFPYTEADGRAWIERCTNGAEPLTWVIEADGQLAGGISLHAGRGVFAHLALIGYWLGHAFWGRGLASAALRVISEHALHTLEFHRLETTVFAWNPASARVLEKNGFTQEGVRRDGACKGGEFVDCLLYARLRHG